MVKMFTGLSLLAFLTGCAMEGSTVDSTVNINRPYELIDSNTGSFPVLELESIKNRKETVEFLDDDGTVYVYQYEVI